MAIISGTKRYARVQLPNGRLGELVDMVSERLSANTRDLRMMNIDNPSLTPSVPFSSISATIKVKTSIISAIGLRNM